MPTFVGRKIQVSDVIMQAERQGCEYRASHLRLVTPEGTFQIKYLYNPKTNGRFDMTDYELDEYMLESEIVHCERRLTITLQ
jgi:hypothetical protein